MTTKVLIANYGPQAVKAAVTMKSHNGEPDQVVREITISSHGETPEYVHSGQYIVIKEIE